jgi:hypothetical protein
MMPVDIAPNGGRPGEPFADQPRVTGDYIWDDSNPGTDFRLLRDVRAASSPHVA